MFDLYPQGRKKKSQVWRYHPSTGEVKKGASWPASPAYLVAQASETACYYKRQIVSEEQYLELSSGLCVCIHTNTYTHTQIIHTYTHLSFMFFKIQLLKRLNDSCRFLLCSATPREQHSASKSACTIPHFVNQVPTIIYFYLFIGIISFHMHT